MTDRLTAMYGKFTAVKNVSLTFANNSVNALIGPSGLRQVNLPPGDQPDARADRPGLGHRRILLDGEDVVQRQGQRDAVAPPGRGWFFSGRPRFRP
jgi:ABC-type phosphate transport system ATPase subunit